MYLSYPAMAEGLQIIVSQRLFRYKHNTDTRTQDRRSRPYLIVTLMQEEMNGLLNHHKFEYDQNYIFELLLHI